MSAVVAGGGTVGCLWWACPCLEEHYLSGPGTAVLAGLFLGHLGTEILAISFHSLIRNGHNV